MPNYQRIFATDLIIATAAAALSACGGSGDALGPGTAGLEASPSPSSSAADAQSRSVALARQTAPSGTLGTGSNVAEALVRALQTQWTPTLAQASGAWKLIGSQFAPAWWTGQSGFEPPVYYSAVVSSGEQLVASVEQCDVASVMGSTRADAAVPIPALDALTATQMSSLSRDQFTSDALGVVSSNRGGSVSVYKVPGQVSVGDTNVASLVQCEMRTYGAGLPEGGDVSVVSGSIETELVDIASEDNQVVAKAFAITTAVSDGRTLATNGTFYVHFAGNMPLSLVKDNIRVLGTPAFVAPLSPADPAVHTAELLVPAPDAVVSGSSPPRTLQVKYDEWTLNLASGLATAGTVTVTDGQAIATIKPTAAGFYEVTMGAGGANNTYSIVP